MVDVRFELTTNDPWSVDDAICELLVCWATGKRLSNHLPKLSLITLKNPAVQGGESVIRLSLGRQ